MIDKVHTAFAKNLLFPAIQFFLKNNCWDYYKELAQTQWHSHEEMQQLQWRKLKKLLEHAYENVSLYRQAFQGAKVTPADINTLNDLKLLPIQTKATLRENYPHNTIAKNVGTIPDPLRVKYHPNIHAVLADLNSLYYKNVRGSRWDYRDGRQWANLWQASKSRPFAFCR
jgi:hypothetical protein